MPRQRTGLPVHVWAHCTDCGFTDGDQRHGQRRGREHAAKTGHKVHVDVGRVYIYDGKEAKGVE